MITRRVFRTTLATTLLIAGSALPAVAADLAVTATYTGKGAVDATHNILVFLFAEANITAESIPITVQAVSSSGGTATFKNVTQDPVYVVMVFNEQANYTGTTGPPPPGLPWAIHGKGGKPIPVSPRRPRR
jgi:hypothetical protein